MCSPLESFLKMLQYLGSPDPIKSGVTGRKCPPQTGQKGAGLGADVPSTGCQGSCVLRCGEARIAGTTAHILVPEGGEGPFLRSCEQAGCWVLVMRPACLWALVSTRRNGDSFISTNTCEYLLCPGHPTGSTVNRIPGGDLGPPAVRGAC